MVPANKIMSQMATGDVAEQLMFFALNTQERMTQGGCIAVLKNLAEQQWTFVASNPSAAS